MKDYFFSTHVYFADTDAGGVMYYANYLRLAEAARAEMLRECGFSSSTLRQECGILIVVKRVEIDYKRPASLDDSLKVVTRVEKMGGTSLQLIQRVTRGADDICTMMITLVCVGSENLRPVRWPEKVFQALT